MATRAASRQAIHSIAFAPPLRVPAAAAVPEFRFSIRAEADLLDIGRYTLQKWGMDQAIRYIDELEACCGQLAGAPGLGRPCDHVRPGLRRMEHGRHIIFYRQEPGGILVSRILHQRMIPERHLLEDAGES